MTWLFDTLQIERAAWHMTKDLILVVWLQILSGAFLMHYYDKLTV